MGHIAAHAQIACSISREIENAIPNHFLPRDEHIYIEFGNFLTDISQFRDPTAQMAAKELVMEAGVQKTFAIPFFSLPVAHAAGTREYADRLLGDSKRRHGDLSEFFKHVSLAMSHQFFSRESNWVQSAEELATDAGHVGITHSFIECLSDLGDLPPDEVDRVFREASRPGANPADDREEDGAFTQYYPHEHLDFPPIKDGPRHRRNTLYQRSRRGLIGYLEAQIRSLSEQFTQLEYDWLLFGGTATERRNLLVRLGHLLHAVEDYFFHSNYVEVRQWQRLQGFYPGIDPETSDGYDQLMGDSLRDTQHPRTSIPLRRRLNRRLRYPVYERGTMTRFIRLPYVPLSPSEDVSDDATELVYTGGFLRKDLMHTISGGLLALEEVLRQPEEAVEELTDMGVPVPPGVRRATSLRDTQLILFRLMFNFHERQLMVAEDLKEDHIETHKRQLKQGLYRNEIERLQAEGHLTRRSAEELEQAFEVDRQLLDDYKRHPGVGGFLIHLLDRVQRTIRRNDRAESRLFTEPNSFLGKATDNGATAEIIGTHTLMAKDGSDKEPLREQAVALATHSSAAVAIHLLTHLNDTISGKFASSLSRGINWDAVLGHYLRFPSLSADRWENQVLSLFRASGERQPDLAAIGDQPNYNLLRPNSGSQQLQQRRDGKSTQVLEQRYQQLESG